MEQKSDNPLKRRTFITGGVAAIGTNALATTALSYGKITGSNDRISMAHIGIGRRGRELASIVAGLKNTHQVEMTAVCDLWSVNRERAAKDSTQKYGRAPRSFQYMDELLALSDVDAVVISTADFQHAPILKLAAEAGKDAYCEKPMANVLEEAKAARDAVRAHKRIVQIGTQHRSEPYQIAARQCIANGELGDISKVEIVWNYHGPRWRGRSEVKQLREQDTDWNKWLLGKAYRPFDPQMYFEFRLYKDFSSGIADQWMSHGIDLAHYLVDDYFPTSVVAHGGVYAWHDGRENPDTFHALLEYPKGLLISYSTSFGNDSDSFTRVMGSKATLVNYGGEGSPRWKLVQERGTHEGNPFVHRPTRNITLSKSAMRAKPWASRLLTGASEKTFGALPFVFDSNPAHMSNWLECLRSRAEPNATVDHGFAHSVAVTMAARAQQEGKKLYWDSRTEQILETAPVATPKSS